jgi:DNA-binding PucR family transcriptional regulator
MTPSLTAEPLIDPVPVEALHADAVGDAVLRQLVTASSAMRRSEEPDRVLDILVATLPMVAPVTSAWAGWKSPGAPLSHTTLFDPTALPSDRSDSTKGLEAALDEWAGRLAPGHAPFEVEVRDSPLAGMPALPDRLAVFPMSSASRVGAVLVAPSQANLSSHQSVIGLLCDHAAAALELVSARGTGNRAEALCQTLTQLAASYSDPEVMLQTIVRSAAQLLGADAAYVMLADEERRLLKVRTAYGITSGAFYEPTYRIDEIFAGAAIRDRRVMCVRDLQAHEQARNSRSEGLRTTMCAPMFVEDELVGVLLAAHRAVLDLSPDDRRIMEALANAAAVSIQGSRLHADREESIERLEQVNALLSERSAAGQRTLAFQRELTELVLAAGGLEQLVATITRTLDCRVLILDRELAVLHASEDAEQAIDLADLKSAIRSVEHDAGISRLGVGEEVVVAPLDLAGERSAYVVVAAGETGGDGVHPGMNEAAVMAIGLELMRDRASAEAEARLTGGLFHALLSGDEVDAAVIARKASYLGYEFSGANAVIVVSADPNAADGVNRRFSLETCIQRAIRRQREQPTAVFERDDTIFVVISDPDEVSQTMIEEHTARIRQELAVSGRSEGVRIAYAGPHRGIEGVRRAADEATYALHVLGVLRRDGKPQAFADLGIWTLLGSVGDTDSLVQFATGVLGVLIEHDAERQTQLIDTMRTLVECNFHYRTAAEALYAHPNTLRYRMCRIKELTGLDFADVDDRLRVELALRVLEVIGPLGADGQPARPVPAASASG